MLGMENSAQIARTDRDLIEARIHAMLDLCAAGDLPRLMTFCTDDVVYELLGNWTIFPFSGPVRGKSAATHALQTIFTHFESLGSTIQSVVVDGDRIAVRRTTRLRNRGTGRADDVAIADFIGFRDGLVCELTEIVDSLAMARIEEG